MANRTRFGGDFRALDYFFGGAPSDGTVMPTAMTLLSAPSAAVSGTATLMSGQVTLTDGSTFNPLSTNAPLLVGLGANQETVTPTAVSGATSVVPGQAAFTATFTKIHGTGDPVASGTFGLQEAINDAATRGGGSVLIDAPWYAAGGTAAIVAAAVLPVTGFVRIEDTRVQTFSFGGGTSPIAEEGNINRQVPGVAGGVSPGATGADNVVAVFSIPAGSFDVAGRGLTITAAGNFAANANTKRVKLFFNPSAAVVGSTITGGTLLSDTGAVTTNAGGWWVGGNVFKRGANGSNTQTCISNGAIAGGTHSGTSLCVDTTAAENAAILVAVTINNTTATTDAFISWLEVNAMN